MNNKETFQLFCKYCQQKFESGSMEQTYKLVREHEEKKHESGNSGKTGNSPGNSAS